MEGKSLLITAKSKSKYQPLIKALLILGIAIAVYYGLYYFVPGLAEHPWIQPILTPLGTIVESLKQYPAQFVTLVGGCMATAVTYMVNRVRSIGTQATQQVEAVSDQAKASMSMLNDNLKQTQQKFETYMAEKQTEIGKLQAQAEYANAELSAEQNENQLLNNQIKQLEETLKTLKTQYDERGITLSQYTERPVE